MSEEVWYSGIYDRYDSDDIAHVSYNAYLLANTLQTGFVAFMTSLLLSRSLVNPVSFSFEMVLGVVGALVLFSGFWVSVRGNGFSVVVFSNDDYVMVKEEKD